MEHRHHNHVFKAFLLGAIAGSAAVFFVNTKHGKKVLKRLTKEGMDGVSDLKKLLTEEIDDEVKPQVKKLADKVKERLNLEEERPAKKPKP